MAYKRKTDIIEQPIVITKEPVINNEPTYTEQLRSYYDAHMRTECPTRIIGGSFHALLELATRQETSHTTIVEALKIQRNSLPEHSNERIDVEQLLVAHAYKWLHKL